MFWLYLLTTVLLMISFLSDRKRTVKALVIAWKKFSRVVLPFGWMLAAISVVLHVLPAEMITMVLGKDASKLGVIFGALIGSIAIIPGFIAFPLCGVLKDQGVSYSVIAAFTTTLMMVGIVSYPVEKMYLGTKITILRNALGFVISMIVALLIGLTFGEGVWL